MQDLEYKGGPSIEEVRSRVETDHIYKMSSNENALGPSPRVLEAIQKTAASLHLYPPREDNDLRAHIAATHARGLSMEHIFTGNSGSEVVELLNRAFVQPGDEVIVSSPTFGLYMRLAGKLNLNLVDVPLDSDTFEYNVPEILASVTDKTRLVYICNPNNPTGTLTLKSAMEALLNGLPERVIVVADEVYYQFVNHPEYPDSIQSVLDNRNIIIVHSFSKTYAMAGLRLGYGIARPELVDAVRHFRCPFHLNALANAAGHAALDDKVHLENTLAMVKEGKEYLAAAFDRLGIYYWPSHTNFIMFKPAVPADELIESLLKRGIMVRPTHRNGFPGGVRVTVGLPEENRAFIEALEAVLA